MRVLPRDASFPERPRAGYMCPSVPTLGREAKTSSAGNDAARPLPAHERFGDDAADWRDTILGRARGAHGDHTLSKLCRRARLRFRTLTQRGMIAASSRPSMHDPSGQIPIWQYPFEIMR